MEFELQIIEFLQAGRSGFFDVAFQVISLMGSYVGAVALALFFLLFSRKHLVCYGVTYGCCYLVQTIMKNAIARPRPFVVSDAIVSIGDVVSSYSMPSGHTICATAIAIFLGAYLFSVYKGKKERIIIVSALTVYVLLVGLSRMYLGKHYLTDILVGIVVASVISAVALVTLHFWQKRGRKKHETNDS